MSIQVRLTSAPDYSLVGGSHGERPVGGAKKPFPVADSDDTAEQRP